MSQRRCTIGRPSATSVYLSDQTASSFPTRPFFGQQASPDCILFAHLLTGFGVVARDRAVLYAERMTNRGYSWEARAQRWRTYCCRGRGSQPGSVPARSAVRESERMVSDAVEVNYPPGGSSTAHRHPGITLVYVLEGEIRSKAGDGPEKTYAPGQMFLETPGQLQGVSRNARDSKPAKFLA